MGIGADTRGVSEVIGAILIFGLAVMLLAIIQTQAIPTANEQVEFDHNQDLQGNLVELHAVATEVAQTGDAKSASVDLGVRYPNRLLFFNPPPATGTVETTEPATAHIENVSAQGPGASQYIDGSIDDLSTRTLTYQPNYNEFAAAPTSRYEYGVLYNNHGTSQTLLNDGGIVSGNEVSLLFPAGDLRESSSGSVSLDARPTSAAQNTVTVGSDGTGPMTLVLPSMMNESLWREALDMTYVDRVTQANGTVRIALNPAGSYSLRMAQIGVGDEPVAQEPAYLHPVDGEELTVPQGQQKIVDIEVRDRYNNPVASEDVTVEVLNEDGTPDGNAVVTTDGDGVAGVSFTAPTEPQRLTLRSTLAGDFNEFDPGSDPEDLEQTLWVTEFAGGIGPEPGLSGSVGDMACGTSDLGDIIDDPIEGLLDDSAAISLNWDASVDSSASTDLDSVEVRMVRQENREIVDSATYDAYGESDVDDTTGLLDNGHCGVYDIQIIAETTGGRTATGTIPDVEPSGGGGGGGGDDGLIGGIVGGLL